MNINYLKYLINSDLYRYAANSNFKTFIKYFFSNRCFKIIFIYRICNYLYNKNNSIILFIFKILLFHYQSKFGIDLFPKTEIKEGFFINHGFGVVIHSDTKIGKNVNISQGVTIGQSNRGIKKGTPTIGDNVFIGPGVCIYGNIKIGNNVAIGANAVVNTDVPDNAVIAGIPATIISYNGTEGYIENTDYPKIYT